MTIKDRITAIKAKQKQIEELISAKEKEVEEEYQMVMELYNEAKNRVEAIQQKQKKTEETLDKYDGLLAFLNDGVEVVEEVKEAPVVEEVKEEIPNKTNDSSENIDELLKLIDNTPKEEKKEVKEAPVNDSKWKVTVEKTTIAEESSNKEEIDSLIDQWELSDSQKGVVNRS